MNENFLLRTITILTFFILWFGFLSLSSYYDQFGVRYSSLSLDINHIIFRGITILFSSLLVSVLFALIVVLCLLIVLDFHVNINNFEISPQKYGPPLLILLFLIQTSAVFISAAALATDDAYLDTTSLPRLVEFYSQDEDKRKFVSNEIESRRVLVLYHSNAALIIFRAGEIKVNAPNLRIATISLNKEDVYVIRNK